MPQKDYIERVIEAFFQVLRQILGLEQVGNYAEAQDLLQRAARQYLGLNLRVLDSLSDKQVVGLLSAGGVLDTERCLLLAELRRVQAAIQEGEGHQAAALATRLSALRLYGEMMVARGPNALGGRTEGLSILLDQIRPYELPADVRRTVWRLYLATGSYARAEDVLFALMEDYPADMNLIDEGRVAYQGLLEKSDLELQAGGLPRAEVDEALINLGGRRASQSPE